MDRVHTTWEGIIKHFLDRTSPNIIFILSGKVILGFTSPDITSFPDQINEILVSVYMSESFFGDYHEMAHIWARIQAFENSYCSNLQLVLCKRLTLSTASIFVTEGLFIYIYFLLFEENHQNRISRAGEKISPTISLFFRKMIA